MHENDKVVIPRSRQELENLANAWRDVTGCFDSYAPDIVRIVEIDLPVLDPAFELQILPANEMLDREGSSSTIPPRIILRQDIYLKAIEGDRRARWTLTLEFAHLILHTTEQQLHRATGQNVIPIAGTLGRRIQSKFLSAEWQADKFTASFLMPEHTANQFRSPLDLSEACLTSYQAAETRMRELGISEQRAKETPEVVRQYLIDAGRWPKKD